MKNRLRSFISFILIFIILADFCPPGAGQRRAVAATSHVTLSNMGRLGNLSVGGKTKSGNWWKQYIGGNEVFCLNLGATCHTGDVYQSESGEYSSNDGGKKGKEACIGYWYEQVRKRNNKAYIMAQALFWAVEEGERSESALRSVIQKIKNNTGYFDGQSASELYRQIFEPSSVVTVRVRLWRYTGSGSRRQILLDVTSVSVPKVRPKSVCVRGKYRQRITLQKFDEDDKPLVGVTFRLEAENIDELYYFKVIGLGNSDQGEVDEDADHFELDARTDGKGQIAYRFNYHVQSEDFYYFDDSELEKMDESARRKARKDLEEEGYRFGKSLTKGEAQDLAHKDMESQFNKIENSYRIWETAAGNDHLFHDSEVKGVVLKKDNSWQQIGGQWPETADGSFENYAQAYRMKIRNRYKKVSLVLKKKDGRSEDGKAYGDADLDGARFQLYEDEKCSQKAYVFNKKKQRVMAGPYVVEGGALKTDYLQSGKVYYLKEIQAPTGYVRSDRVIKIQPDARHYQVEYSDGVPGADVINQPITGKIALQKYSTDGTTGPIASEIGAHFQVYLASKGSYDKADEKYERDVITTDKNGYACTKDLYYGRYIVHQLDSGDRDTERVEDFEVFIRDENRTEPYRFVMNDKPFQAFLRILKKDGNTSKEVLKAGTIYQIYRVDKQSGEEALVKQSYSNGHGTQIVDRFSSDHTGRIMTVDALPSGTYRIYETEAASGLHISREYIEVEISSKADNYVREKDSEGNTYTTVTLDYINEETYGRLSLLKKGEQLRDFRDGRFIYEETWLKGAIFEIYADQDIETQDNQGTHWFEKGDLVGTITTGTGAEFTSGCGGITAYTMDDQGTVTVHLPLGRYRVEEKQTAYGYVLPDKKVWDVEFTWKDKGDEYVLNSTDSTNESGVMSVKNERARTAVSLCKTDNDSRKPVSGARFAIYSKDAIYNADGERIAEPDLRLGTVETDSEGKADFDLDFPLMSEGYASGDRENMPEMQRLNSGDYYIQEQSVSGSYFSSDRRYPVHLEYKDAATPVITCRKEVENVQTSVRIDKVSVTGSGEIPGCHLEITDTDNNRIVSWISGHPDTVRWYEELKKEGYENPDAWMDEKGNLMIRGLLQDQEYTLTETRPADGYVTADSVAFRPVEFKEEGQSVTRVEVRGMDGNYTEREDNVVRMVDEQTKIQFCKYAEDHTGLLGEAGITVFDQAGKQVCTFVTTKDEPEELNGVLAVGKTYLFRETEAPKGYEKAPDILFTVQDTKELQRVNMTDLRAKIVASKKIPKGSSGQTDSKAKVPQAKKPAVSGKQPETGQAEEIAVRIILLLMSGVMAAILGRRRFIRTKK